MPTFTEFVTEIENSFSTYADSNDLDRADILRWCTNEMRRFGNNILSLYEDVLDIENSQAQLPVNFKNLRLAWRVEPFGYTLNDITNEEFRGSFVYSRHIEHPAYFNQTTHEYIADCRSQIVEQVITIGGGSASVYYHPQWLKVTKAVKNNSIAKDCLNISKAVRNACDNEISITAQTMNANFSTGQVYIQFYGYDIGQDGEIYIPEGTMGNIEKYLEFYCKSRICENLIANNKNPQSLSQLLPFYEQKVRETFDLAHRETKFLALGSNWQQKIKVQNRRRTQVFNLPSI